MQRSHTVSILLVLVLLTPLACTDEETTTDAATGTDTLAGEMATPVDTAATMAGAATLGVSQQEPYGEYLVDGQGRALYLFMADEGQDGSACNDACADAWPPFTVTGSTPPSGDATSVQSDQIGTIQRDDGETQVTYGGWPLYYFSRDQGPDDVQGQDVEGFGAEWYLVSPMGEPVHGEDEEM